MLSGPHPDDEHVPTSLELVKMGAEYATVVEWVGATKTKPGKPSKIRIMGKGHRLLGDIMRRNGLAAIERDKVAAKALIQKLNAEKVEPSPWEPDPWAKG